MSDKPAPTTQPAYRFRYANITLERYLADRRCVAKGMGLDAQTLIAKAEMIEAEANNLESELQEAKADE